MLERLANGEDLGGVGVGGVGNELKWEERRIERGAKIVVASESEMSLVLQATRGNLETIYPRPMVLQVVKRDVLGQVQSCLRYQGGTYANQSKTLKKKTRSGAYRAAFLTCRKHRLDLNILYDLDPEKFMANLENFVEQVYEVDYLNLFISSLKYVPLFKMMMDG